MSKDKGWETLDTQEAVERQRRQQEQTTSANVGGFPVPIGQPLRRQAPIPPYKEVKPKKRDEEK